MNAKKLLTIAWTAEELEEMRRADDEIEREFREERWEREAAKKRDAVAKLLALDNRLMRRAENMRRYREENKDRIAEYMRRYREENKDRIAENMRRYREENKDKQRAYMREYMRKYTARKRAAQGSAAAPGGNDSPSTKCRRNGR